MEITWTEKLCHGGFEQSNTAVRAKASGGVVTIDSGNGLILWLLQAHAYSSIILHQYTLHGSTYTQSLRAPALILSAHM